MPRTDVTQMLFSKVYPLLVQKAQRKGRTREEVAQVTAWLTGYSPEDLTLTVEGIIKASPHNCVCGLRPIFCPIRAVIKGGNTYSIPALL